MDILPTREGTPVIFHDTSLLRATGVDADIRQVHHCGEWLRLAAVPEGVSCVRDG